MMSLGGSLVNTSGINFKINKCFGNSYKNTTTILLCLHHGSSFMGFYFSEALPNHVTPFFRETVRLDQ